MLKNSILLLNLGVIFFAVGFWLFRVHTPCQGQEYLHINPDLRCDHNYVLEKSSLYLLGLHLREYIDFEVETGNAEIVSVYARDLVNGPTMGINELERYSPASLLKLPVLLTYLRLQEEYGPALFETELIYTDSDADLQPLITPGETIQVNVPYTVEELIRSMIIYSDNRAYITLHRYLNELSPEVDELKETHVDLGVIDPQDFTDQTLSTKTYASIFTQLFHASYLRERASSERALDLLAQAEYKRALEAGVPNGIEVAHKFGERFGFDNDIKQLHDCGIVYYPENPYLLCVMTRGQDMEKLQDIIATISTKVYVEFDSRKY
jgi:beta-lactamase class A